MEGLLHTTTYIKHAGTVDFNLLLWCAGTFYIQALGSISSMRENFRPLLLNALKDGLNIVKEFLDENKQKDYWWRLEKYKDYPTQRAEDGHFPSFYLSDYEKTDYSQILTKDSKAEKIESWQKYHQYVTSSEELQKFYEIGKYAEGPAKSDNELWSKIFTYYHLAGFVDRYIHLKEGNTDFQEELFEKQCEKFEKAIFNRKLKIEVHIPILLLKFNFEEVRLNDKVSLRLMDKKLQLSRHGKISYTDSSKSTVAAAATHSLVLKDWIIENHTYNSRERALNEISSYTPILSIAEDFFSSLRIKIGAISGFCQIVALASGWEDRTYGDLEHVDVVSIRRYPDHFDNYGWLSNPEPIGEPQITEVFDFLEQVSKNDQNNINLALSRLNRSYLRSREEDTILDITIALETLLTHDSKSEITYRLASRVAAICVIKPFKDYSQFQVFEFCKKIYSFRSAIVHGDFKRVGKTKIIKYQENQEISTITLSIELLRHVLEFLIENPNFNSPEELDKLKYEKNLLNKRPSE